MSNPTFYHFNGVVTSQIDYFLSNDPQLFQSYCILQKNASNVSSHVPVQVCLPLSVGPPLKVLPKCTLKYNPKIVYIWDKLDSEKIIEYLEMSRQDICSSNVNETIEQLTSCLKTAAKASVPIKTLTLKGPKRCVSGKVLQCLKRVKSSYNECRQAVKPKSGHLFLENKLVKRCLRSQRRMEEVTRRKSFYDSLMENPSPKMFYKLIRKCKSMVAYN